MAGFDIEPQAPVPGSQQWTPGGQGYRVDFRVRGTRVVVEFDGRVKYTDERVLWDEESRTGARPGLLPGGQRYAAHQRTYR